MIDKVEAERNLYALRPSRSEVVRQLVNDGLAFRLMYRPRSVVRRMNRQRRGLPEKPGKVPFKFTTPRSRQTRSSSQGTHSP